MMRGFASGVCGGGGGAERTVKGAKPLEDLCDCYLEL